ncbi:MAG: NACHT domain-containing protein [bacterium]|nr:NACHT domain-containing protein [bacterium]
MSASEALKNYCERIRLECESVDLSGIPYSQDSSGRLLSLTVPLGQCYGRLQALQGARFSHSASYSEIIGLHDVSEHSLLHDVLNALRRSGEEFYREGKVYRALERPETLEPQAALHKYQRLLILGAPGSGKSTLLQFLAYDVLCRRDGMVPVFVPLKDYARAVCEHASLSLREFALARAARNDSELRNALEQTEQILWLLDDLDALQHSREIVAEQLEELVGELVLSSRPQAYHHRGLETLYPLEILAMSAEDVDNFLDDCFIALTGQLQTNWDWAERQTTLLKNQFLQNSSLRILARNPLLLTYLCVFSESERLQEAPGERVLLYERCVESVFDFRYKDSALFSSPTPAGVKDENGDKPVRQIFLHSLCFLGWYLQRSLWEERGRPPIARQMIIDELARCLTTFFPPSSSEQSPSAEAIVSFWIEAGFLEQRGDALFFRHTLFREYAAAGWLAKLAERSPEAAWNFWQPRLHHEVWQETLVLFVELLGEKPYDEFLRQLLAGPSLYDNALHRDVPLATKLLRTKGASYASLKQDVLKTLDSSARALWQQGQKNLKIVYITVTLLLFSGSVPFLSFPSTLLLVLLWSGLWWVAFGSSVAPRLQSILALPLGKWISYSDPVSVVRALERCHFPETLSLLTEFAHDSQTEARRVAIEALGKIHEPAHVEILLQAMEDPQADIRRTAAFSLKNLGKIPTLIQALRNQHEGLRNAAAEALAQSRSEQTIAALAEGLEDEKEYVRRLAVKTLKEIGGEQAIPPLLQACHDADKELRLTAVEALGQIGAQESDMSSRLRIVSALVKTLDDEVSSVQWAAAYALGQIRDRDTIPALVQALRKNQTHVNRAISDALRHTVTHRSASHMLKALNDPNVNVRRTAVNILGELGECDPEIVPALLHCMQDADNTVRRDAIGALGELQSVQAIPLLIEMLKAPEWELRWAAAGALGRIGPSEAVEQLLPLLQDSDGYVCRAAAEALGHSGDGRTIPHLLHALNSKNPYVQQAAGKALGEVGKSMTVPYILQAIKEGEQDVIRKDLEDALRYVSDASVVPFLLEALQDETPQVRRVAVNTLGHLGTAEAGSSLIALLKDADDHVRRSVVQVLGKIREMNAVPPLIEALKDENRHIRQAAAQALGFMKAHEAVPALIESVGSADYLLRQAAVEALGRIGDSRALGPLLEALRDREWKARWSAVYALGRIGDAQALPFLHRCLLEEEDVILRKSAAVTLGQLRRRESVTALSKGLSDEDWQVRWAAVYSLGQIADPSVWPYLLEVLNDNQDNVRREAARVLGLLGDVRVVPYLILALKDAHWEVCKTAAHSITLLSKAATVPYLIQAMEQRNEFVRRTVASILQNIKEKDALPYFLEAIESEHTHIRRIAAVHLVRLADAQIVPQLLALLQHRNWKIRQEAAGVLGKIAPAIEELPLLRQCARALWWRLSDHEAVGKSAFYALEQFATQLALQELTVPQNDPGWLKQSILDISRLGKSLFPASLP